MTLRSRFVACCTLAALAVLCACAATPDYDAEISRGLVSVIETFPPHSTVSIDQTPAPNGAAILAALKSTGPTGRVVPKAQKLLRIELSNPSGSFETTAARDAKTPNVYWMYFGWPTTIESFKPYGRLETVELGGY